MMGDNESYFTAIIDAESGRLLDFDFEKCVIYDIDRLNKLSRAQFQVIFIGYNNLQRFNTNPKEMIHFVRKIIQHSFTVKNCHIAIGGIFRCPKTDWKTKADN